jgi:hypothetical protein
MHEIGLYVINSGRVSDVLNKVTHVGARRSQRRVAQLKTRYQRAASGRSLLAPLQAIRLCPAGVLPSLQMPQTPPRPFHCPDFSVAPDGPHQPG